ncbi:uncharacterized protein ATC70_003667 [Mucor velutinosus]|uniref:F-box domain-containing protein n=1 Tax=Mucor velutinosus TaxID=708070 RepID=A0AAN7D8L4_9FUNG|nr:hypothetical protein ATC70_003667 [Mucor velutinosus]
MDRLPGELLLYILSHLNFKDKLQCNLVSQEWHTRLKQTILYQGLLFRNPYHLHQAIDFFTDTPFRETVHRLDMSLCELPVATFMNLSLVFPRLKYLHIADFDPKFKAPRRPLEIEAAILSSLERSVQRWEYLEGIVERSGSYPIIMSFLKAPEPVYLTSINITYNKRHGSIGKYQHNLRSLIKLTKNAPWLEQFCARFTFVSLLDFEELHQNCPKLHTISVTTHVCDSTTGLDKWFDSEADLNHFLPYHRSNIDGTPVKKTAQSLRHLKIKLAKSFMSVRETEMTMVTINNWLQYIGLKYPNLASFDMHKISNGLEGMQAPEKQFEQQISFALSQMTSLEMLNSNLVPLSTNVVQSIPNVAGDFRQCTLYSFKHYTIQKQLERMQSLNNLNKLTVLHIISNKNNKQRAPLKFSLLESFSNLTQLTFTSQVNNCKKQISDIFANTPHLEALTLSSVCPVALNEPLCMANNKLKVLQIRRFNFFEPSDWFDLNLALKKDILPFCPMLRRFDFSTVRAEYRSDVSFLLALDFRNNHHLQKVNINLLASTSYRIDGQKADIALCPFAVYPFLPKGFSEYTACTLIDLPHPVSFNKDMIE